MRCGTGARAGRGGARRAGPWHRRKGDGERYGGGWQGFVMRERSERTDARCGIGQSGASAASEPSASAPAGAPPPPPPPLPPTPVPPLPRSARRVAPPRSRRRRPGRRRGGVDPRRRARRADARRCGAHGGRARASRTGSGPPAKAQPPPHGGTAPGGEGATPWTSTLSANDRPGHGPIPPLPKGPPSDAPRGGGEVRLVGPRHSTQPLELQLPRASEGRPCPCPGPPSEPPAAGSSR